MKNNLILTIITLMFFSCNKDETAKIEVNKEINFGVIKVNDTIKKSFVIKNNSSIDLKIKDIKSSCGCTVAKLKDSLIKENESTDLIVEFIANKDKIGKIKNSIVVEANTNPVFTVLYLTGTVK